MYPILQMVTICFKQIKPKVYDLYGQVETFVPIFLGTLNEFCLESLGKYY